MSTSLSQLADELTNDLKNFQRVKSDVLEAQSRLGSQPPDNFERRAIGSILHDVYQGMENICARVYKSMDLQTFSEGSESRSEHWHADLIRRVSHPLPNVRPAVLQIATAENMKSYRNFRHVFRHAYGFDLDWQRMKPGLDVAIPMIDAFTKDVEQFINFLRMQAQEEG